MAAVASFAGAPGQPRLDHRPLNLGAAKQPLRYMWYFNTTPDNIPAQVPYLHAEPARVAHWRERLDTMLPRGLKRIGLAWTGRPTHPNDRRRSMRLARLLRLAEAGPAAFVSLQKPMPDADVETMKAFNGMTDLSNDLTDFGETPLYRVFEMVKREAARHGVMAVSSEIVGMIPKKALEQAAEWFLQVENFDSSLILENRLAAVMGGKMAVGGLRAGVEPFVEQLAAPTATPGGGSASAAAGAMAAGLAVMVASMSRGKKAYMQHETQLSAAIASLTPLREELKAAVDADAESYNSVMKAYKAAKADEKSGERRIEAALKEATAVPLGVAEKAYEVAQLVKLLEPITNPNMKSDLTTASALALAAITGALANVEINLASIEDEAFAAEVRQRTSRLRS